MMKFIDLGLPSGTLWANINIGANSVIECGPQFTFPHALKVGFSIENRIATLPSLRDAEELITYCSFAKIAGVYKYVTRVIGPNGNKIFMPMSHRTSNCYWTQTVNPFHPNFRACELYIGTIKRILCVPYDSSAYVRLVAKSDDCL